MIFIIETDFILMGKNNDIFVFKGCLKTETFSSQECFSQYENSS